MSMVSFLDKKKSSTPTEFTHYVKSGGDLYYWEMGGFWVVTKMELAKIVMTGSQFSADRSKFFVSRMPNMDLSLIKDFFSVVQRMMVMSDGKEHSLRRKLAAFSFSDKLIKSYGEIVDRVVKELLDKKVQDGRVDFAQDIAVNLPSIVLADLFRIPESERPDFFRWSNNMTAFFGGASQYRNEDGIEVNQSAQNLYRYFSDLIKRRSENPEDDFLSTMLVWNKKFKLANDEIISQAIMMLVAGQVTTTDQLCNNMFALLEEPTRLAKVQRERRLLSDSIEECNRIDPAVTFLFRVAKEDVELGGRTIKAGDTVFISNHAVNRDSDVFERADEFDAERKDRMHFAYGYGPHFCIGSKLARIQMNALYGQMLDRYSEIKIDGDAERWHYSLAFSGFQKLPLYLKENIH